MFAIPDAESLEPHLDARHAAGCDDAAFMGPAADGTFTAEFDREAGSFVAAVASALHGIQSAIPRAGLLRALPDDLVTIAAMAARTGRTDESVRLLAQGRVPAAGTALASPLRSRDVMVPKPKSPDPGGETTWPSVAKRV